MPYDPWKHRPKSSPAQTRTFSVDGEELSLTFRKMGQVAKCAAYESVLRLKQRYITGNEETGDPPMDFPPVAGVAVRINETVIDTAVSLAAMQPDDAPERYSAEDFIAMQISMDSSEWDAVQAFAAEVNRAERPKDEKAPSVPNGSGAATKASYAPPSSTPGSTLRLSPEQTLSSGPSTSDWQEEMVETLLS